MNNENEPKKTSRLQYKLRIDETDYKTDCRTVTGRKILEIAGKDMECHFVTQVIPNADDQVIGLDDPVDLGEPGKERFTIVAKPPSSFHVCIEGILHPWSKDTITAEEIAQLGGWPVSEGVLIISSDNSERTLQPGEAVTLGCDVSFGRKVKFRRG